MANILIIGGSDAGISAALRIKELSNEAKVSILLRDEFPNFSICGLPMYLSGEVRHWKDLAHRTKADIENEGITLYTSYHAISVDPEKKVLKAKKLLENDEIVNISYDKLILGTGAVSREPQFKGMSLPGVYTLRWMSEVLEIKEFLKKGDVKSAVVVGGGYVGLELADGLTKNNIQTNLVESNKQVLRTVHPSFGQRVMENLEDHGVTIATETRVEEVEKTDDGKLKVIGTNGYEKVVDFVIICIGAIPNTELGESAGCKLGDLGAFTVNDKMETNVPDIYAAGDCIETKHCLLKDDPIYLALGTTSHKQGRIAGENAIGGSREFAGIVGTQVIKIFDTAVGRTGLRHDEAEKANYNPVTIEFETYDHKVYYPGANKIVIRLTADEKTTQILGAQIYGHHQGQIAKRIDIFAIAIFHKMTVEEFQNYDLAYTPPLSSPWDPTQMAAQAWIKSQINK